MRPKPKEYPTNISFHKFETKMTKIPSLPKIWSHQNAMLFTPQNGQAPKATLGTVSPPCLSAFLEEGSPSLPSKVSNREWAFLLHRIPRLIRVQDGNFGCKTATGWRVNSKQVSRGRYNCSRNQKVKTNIRSYESAHWSQFHTIQVIILAISCNHTGVIFTPSKPSTSMHQLVS